jgi:hypothetical protein
MAIRNDFAPGEVLAAADLNDTFGSKAPTVSPTFTGTVTIPNVNLGAWTSFTPTYANITVGNGTQAHAWTRVGRLVVVRGAIVLGSTGGVFNGGMTMTTPATATMPFANQPVGWAVYGDASAGTSFFGQILWSANSIVVFTVANTSGNYAGGSGLTTTIPFTWTPADGDYFAYTYVIQVN